MPPILTDAQIQELIDEPKPLPDDYEARLTPKPARGHTERDLHITGTSGNHFEIRIRQAVQDPFDFSVILMYHVPGSNVCIRLRRYNGSHEHTNPIERTKLDGFHIHKATERYQALGPVPDKYAELTTAHFDLRSALARMLADCGFVMPIIHQALLC
jgi:hypothetical protein